MNNRPIKELQFREEAINNIIEGMTKVDKLVSPTMGAMGQFAIIEMPGNDPLVINDGINIARQVELENKGENIGARLLISAMNTTARRAGDSTSLTCNLMTNLVRESHRVIKEEKLNPTAFAEGLRAMANKVLKYIQSISKPVETNEELYNASFIASREKEISNLIVEALEKIGENGVIQKMRSYKNETYLEVIKGMVLDFGLLSASMLKPEDKQYQTSSLQNVKVLILKDKLVYAQDVANILNNFAIIADENYQKTKQKMSFLIIAEEYSEEVLDNMVNTKRNKKFFEYISDFQAILAPGKDKADKEENLGDIESLTLGKMTLTKTAIKDGVDEFKKYLGDLDESIVQINNTLLRGLNKDEIKTSVNQRVSVLKALLEDREVTNHQIKEHALKHRISKLDGGVAIIRIFGATDIEFQDLMEKTDDALRTVRSAQSGGILPGGGNALKSAYFYFEDELTKNIPEVEDKIRYSEFLGKKIMVDTLIKPFEQICSNAGIYNPKERFENEIDYRSYDVGINVSTWQTANLFKEGIVDATTSIAFALKHAVSNTIMTIRANGSILYVEKD